MKAEEEHHPDCRYLTTAALKRRHGISQSTLKRRIAEGAYRPRRFPGSERLFFLVSEIAALEAEIDSQPAEPVPLRGAVLNK